ncbi:MAG: methyl-accepting chemotaxis protein [Nitrospiraceae bacterium]
MTRSPVWSGYFNEFIEKLQKMIKKVAHVTDRFASASVELSARLEEINKGTENLTSRASRTAAAVEEMNATVRRVAPNTGKAASLAQDTVKTAQEGGAVVSSCVSGMQRAWPSTVSNSATIITPAGSVVDQIGESIRSTSPIRPTCWPRTRRSKYQSRRAGAWIAVVADEVRKLAERTTKATKEIGDMIARSSMIRAVRWTPCGKGPKRSRRA